MADARALLAAARHSRRITHPHLAYVKSGALVCTICNLNIKSEQLWPGHLRSSNHKRNVLSSQESRPKSQALKRKHSGSDDEESNSRDVEFGSRKKPRSFSTSGKGSEDVSQPQVHDDVADTVLRQPAPDVSSVKSVHFDDETQASTLPAESPLTTAHVEPVSTPAIDEDEWAAFEKDMAPLAQPDYTSATIEAAPVSVTETNKDDSTKAASKEDEAKAELDDAARRLEDEVEIMEQMEDRMRRLRERREAFRKIDSSVSSENIPSTLVQYNAESERAAFSDPSSDEGEDADGWYG